MALLNIGSESPQLRVAAYNLLYSLSLSFRFDIGNQLLNAKGNIEKKKGGAQKPHSFQIRIFWNTHPTKNKWLNLDLCIPSNSSDFIVSISESLAQSEIHLTLEFLNEAFVGFLTSNEPMRQLCLDYMVPWLKNLGVFLRHSLDDYKKNLSKTKDVISLLIDLTVKRVEVSLYLENQKKICLLIVICIH